LAHPDRILTAIDAKWPLRDRLISRSSDVAQGGDQDQEKRNMNYGNLAKRPFEIVARRPYLWLLGLLAGGATAFNFSGRGSGPGYGRPAGAGSYQGPSAAVLQSLWNDNWGWIVGIIAVLIVLGVILFILGSIATGGIIRAAVEHDAGREYRLGTAWRAGYATFWRIAGLRLLVALVALVPGLLVGALVLGAVAGAQTSAAAAVGFGLLAAAAFLFSLVFWLALSVAFELAQRIVVLEHGHVAESLGNGFRMLRWHLGEVALGWLILVALSIGVGIAGAILAVLVGVPAAALGFGGWAVGGMTGAIVTGSVAIVFFLGVLLAAGGAYAAYSSVYWTLLFTSVRALPAPAPGGAMAPAA
jgi:hypothetical protein